MSRIAAGIDLGGTNLKVALIDADGGIAAKRSSPFEPASGARATLKDMVRLVDELLAETSRDREALVGAGIGAPGPLDLQAGKIVRSVNLPGWCDVLIRDRLSEALGVPVTLENDGNAAAFGEHWMGGGDNLVLLTLGTGVGAGVIIDGRVLHGHFDNAAELGHMIVAADGPPCTCGQRGCLETFASVSGMAKRIAAAIADGEDSVMDGSAAGDINGVAIVEAARSGDVLCRRIWEEACRYLAIACINIQHIYNPQRILLAGGLSLAGAYLLEPIRSQVQRRRWNMYEDLPEIALSPLGEDAGLVGAGGLAWKTSAAAASAESRP